MENKKLDLGKITITRLTNLHHIKGGNPFTIAEEGITEITLVVEECTIKTHEDLIDVDE